MDSTRSQPPHLYGLDLLKLASLIIVTIFHFIVLVWYPHSDWYDTVMSQDTGFLIFNQMLYPFWYFGWTLMAVAAFLVGKKEKHTFRFYFQLTALLLLGWPLLNAAYYKFAHFSFEWDVYPALAVCFLICFAIFKLNLSPLIRTIGVAVSILICWLAVAPNERFFNNQFLNSVFFGGCHNRESGFPLLPLAFFIFAFFFIGQAYRRDEWKWLRKPQSLLYEGIGFGAVGIVIPMLLMGPNFFFWGARHIAVLNAECTTIEFMPIAFWAEFTWSALLLRLSLIDSVNLYLKKRFHKVSGLIILRQFALAYFISYMVAALFNRFGQETFLNQRIWFYAAALLILPITEMILRLIRSASIRRDSHAQ